MKLLFVQDQNQVSAVRNFPEMRIESIWKNVISGMARRVHCQPEGLAVMGMSSSKGANGPEMAG